MILMYGSHYPDRCSICQYFMATGSEQIENGVTYNNGIPRGTLAADIRQITVRCGPDSRDSHNSDHRIYFVDFLSMRPCENGTDCSE